MNKLDITSLKALENKFRNIQKNLAKSLFKLNRKHPNTISKNWKRKGGGGGKSISISGDVIEKAAVNFSSISGTNLPGSSISSKIQTKNLSRFHAVGVSVISHPSNPFCPTSHMNVRIFFVLGKNNKIKDWWIGGGFDLTPYFSTNKENAFWHNQAKAMLEKFNKNYYKKFAKECDEYFYLPHRNEKRVPNHTIGSAVPPLEFISVEFERFAPSLLRTILGAYFARFAICSPLPSGLQLLRTISKQGVAKRSNSTNNLFAAVA